MTELVLRVFFSLAVVVGLLMLAARIANKRFRGRSGATIEVIHRQQLTRGSAISVVSVGPRVLVLGMTDHQVNVLTELDPMDLAVAEIEVEAPTDLGPGVPLPPRAGTAPSSPLAGSVLSPQTWRQALSAVSGGRSADR
jgi:flagellar protein FliO/FliZ